MATLKTMPYKASAVIRWAVTCSSGTWYQGVDHAPATHRSG